MEIAGSVVAIVDDDDAVRRALRRLLLSLGCRPAPFESGETFLAGLQLEPPDCAVIDQHMPGMRGLDVLLRMRAHSMKTPAILITGHDEAGLRERCLAAGASDYLVKPIGRDAIAEAIGRALSR